MKNMTFKKITSQRLFLPIFCLALVLLINIVTTPNFFAIEVRNGVLYGYLIDIINRASELVILAVGMTLVVSSSAGTDISVGAIMAVSAAVCCNLLTGGERARVSIAKLMLTNANFLILDEPTNHLDITSKEILEEALNNYTGTVLYVSHDRYFINRTATRILELTSETFINYIGNYDYYLEKHDLMNQLYAGVNGTASSGDRTASKHGTADPSRSGSTAAVSTASAPVSNGRSDWKAQREEQAKLRKKQNELKKVEEEIATLESRGEELDEQIQQPEIASNIGKLMEIHKEKEAVDARLAELYERWEQLAEDM